MASVNRQKNPTVHLAAGGVSGLVSCVLLQPLDLVFRSLANITLFTTLNDVVKKDGVSGLWRGTLPTILRNVPGSALYFLSVHSLRSTMERLGVTKNTSNLIAGAASRVVIGFAAMPITVVKIRYESNLYTYKSLWNSMSSIWRTEGIPGFFRGFGATILRDAPYAGIYVFFYENFKLILGDLISLEYMLDTFLLVGAINSPVAINLGAGMLSGFSATLLTQPFDMMKTRMQLKPLEYPSLLQSFAKISAAEGMTGFFSGIVPRLIRKSLGSAISWTLYEEVVRQLS
ncbi:hypothetical protein BATDEDRAFT_14698 [Batrachochytrium dendrobatidis JAM81]|uniref:Mitochondrial glycine transporter n=1 Tax=Batrachochytrium dendrobatidis (strain JAM81 / FGSC 10211) TaxID=684364 RepID=F4PDJ0_BATDJ|nr:uncharacterized protein BATDEDRAFT_14698 [Batrachochytrium dendrobatidis JAM81]EGF76792.1 hypothetical protein BATDEDRAFT_14698 [Batrachochytrium dendrobatidis JAM81]|eukprot:XP_006682568.1 hypothetical protein BATDEDRAFT_14698 [Batrachochytrium dendrobatidis JAM81]